MPFDELVIPPRPGNTNAIESFVGRAKTTSVAVRKLAQGQDLLLADPRRMGKTFWCKHFAATCAEFNVVYVDFEGVASIQDFLLRLAGALRPMQNMSQRLSSAIGDTLSLNIDLAFGPATLSGSLEAPSALRMVTKIVNTLEEDTEKTVAKGKSPDKRVVICLDELPLALLNIANREGATVAGELLQTLRGLRLSTRYVRWVLCGSIGFHHVLPLCEATEGEINDLEALPLGPLPESEARVLAAGLFRGIDASFDNDSVSLLCRLTGGIPFLMHKITSLMQDSGAKVADVDCLGSTYTSFVQDRDSSAAMSHVLTRMEDYYGTLLPAARSILDETAMKNSESTSASELVQFANGDFEQLNLALNLLVQDHYLLESEEGVRWRYAALQDIWRRRRRLHVRSAE